MLDSDTFAATDDMLRISTQNDNLDEAKPDYAIDDARFVIGPDDPVITLNSSATVPNGPYQVTITADVSGFGPATHSLDAEINVRVNTPPTVSGITGDATISEGASGTLTGTATDGDGTVSLYSWSVNSTSAVTITTGDMATLEYTASQVTSDTAVRFTLTVTDDDGATGSGTHDVTVTNVVANQPPTAGAFATTWRTTSTDESITLPIVGSGMTVNWGDGNTAAASGSVNHTYNAAGNYTIQITGGLTKFTLDGSSDASNLVSLDQWGNASWTTMEDAFYGARNMAYNATDVPDLSGVTDMDYMFRDATSFNGNLSRWDVSAVTDMDSMFKGATSFNGDLSGWDVPAVTNMDSMFEGATSFDRSLNSWSVSAVTDMSRMFEGATSFNQDLDGWDVSAVADMYDMFKGATSFDRSLNSWNVPAVTDMSRMFEGATSFDQDLDGWDVSAVTGMSGMFKGATSFNGNLSGWNVSAVTNMDSMFEGATSFNRSLNSWDVSAVTGMSRMFEGASGFNQNLGNWFIVLDSDTFAATDDMLRISTQNDNLDEAKPDYAIDDARFVIGQDDPVITLNSSATVPNDSYQVTITADVSGFGTATHSLGAEINVQVNTPPTVGITGDATISEGASGTLTGTATDGDGTVSLYSWSVNSTSAVTITTGDMATLEYTASQVTSDTAVRFTLTVTDDDGATGSGTHDVTVTNVVANQPPTVGAFATTWRTTSTDESITLPIVGSGMTVNWGDGNTTAAPGSVNHTYNAAGNYTIQITGGLTRFNLDGGADASNLVSLDQWGNASWTTMEDAFYGASNMAYNATDVPDLSGVTDTSYMFRDATSFNGNLSGWDVSAVTDMDNMFKGATSFNGDLSGWRRLGGHRHVQHVL